MKPQCNSACHCLLSEKEEESWCPEISFTNKLFIGENHCPVPRNFSPTFLEAILLSCNKAYTVPKAAFFQQRLDYSWKMGMMLIHHELSELYGKSANHS